MAAKIQQKRARARSADDAAPRSTVRGKPADATGAFPTLAPALVRRRPRRTSRRAKRPSPQPSRRRRGTTLLNSLREAAHVKKPPRTKNNCSSTCWSGGDGLGSPAMITNEARAARTHLPRDGAVGSWAPSAALGRGIYRRARCEEAGAGRRRRRCFFLCEAGCNTRGGGGRAIRGDRDGYESSRIRLVVNLH